MTIINDLCAARSNGEPFTGNHQFPCNASTIEIISFSLITSLFGIIMIMWLRRHLVRYTSNDYFEDEVEMEQVKQMNKISDLIKNGSRAFLLTQYKYLTLYVVIVFSILLILYSLNPPSGNALDGLKYSICFLGGSLLSGLSGWISMNIATNTNILVTKKAAKSVPTNSNTTTTYDTSNIDDNDNDIEDDENNKQYYDGLCNSLHVAFTGGSLMGFTIVIIGMLGLSLFYFLVSIGYDDHVENNPNSNNGEDGKGETEDILLELYNLQMIANILSGFGFGASSIALFARVAGGIYTKGADIGADLVGKVENDIPEDDPRNPGVIADLVGDNVGDIAGMGADLFESYVSSIIACIALSNGDVVLIMLPLWIVGCGIIASIIGYFVVGINNNTRRRRGKQKNKGVTQKQLLFALHKGTIISSIFVLIFSSIVIWQLFPGRETYGWKLYACIAAGLISGILIGQTTEYFTSYEYYPTQSIISAGRTGPATIIIQGLGVGMISCLFPVIIIVSTILFCSILLSNEDDTSSSLYGISIASVGMLSTLATTLSFDTLGPIVDNAGGIVEMIKSPQPLHSSVRTITDTLDSLGNTTAATGKGFAIGSAVLTSLSLLSAFTDAAYIDDVNIKDPVVLSGSLIGAMLPFLFAALTMISVQKVAKSMILEVRRQFNEIPGLLVVDDSVSTGTADAQHVEADYNKCIAISTKSSIEEMILPGLYAILSPIIVGLLIGPKALTGMLGGSITSGMMLSIMMSNTGGSWDNSKKYIEINGEEHLGHGKGSDIHKSCVIGDTVGDPFKDTSGPALNILIKLMSIIALTLAPLLKGKDDWEDFYIGLIPLTVLIIGTYLVIKLFWTDNDHDYNSNNGHSSKYNNRSGGEDGGDLTREQDDLDGSVRFVHPAGEIEATSLIT